MAERIILLLLMESPDANLDLVIGNRLLHAITRRRGERFTTPFLRLPLPYSSSPSVAAREQSRYVPRLVNGGPRRATLCMLIDLWSLIRMVLSRGSLSADPSILGKLL